MPVLFNVNEAAKALGGIPPWTLRKHTPRLRRHFHFLTNTKEELT